MIKIAKNGQKLADTAGNGKAAVKCANSFTGDTHVLMADGTTKPIDQIKVGDKITNSEPEDDKTETHVVLAVIVTDADKHYVALTITTLDGNKTIRATAHHPIYNASDGEWTDAGDLAPGDQLDTPHNERAAVHATRHYTATLRTYNLSVHDTHTYYVLAGHTPVLVHNTGQCDPVVGFAQGEGVTALTDNRLQHGTKHLVKAGLLPNWSGKASSDLIRRKLSPILENPTRTVDHELGGTAVKGFLGYLDGTEIAVFVYKEGPYAGQLASSSIPTPNQLAMWGL